MKHTQSNPPGGGASAARLSRRSFGKLAAASVLGVTMCGARVSSAASLSIDQIALPSPCRNTLHLLLPGTTVSDILHGPFINLLGGMIVNLESGYTPVEDADGKILAKLRAVRDYIEQTFGDSLCAHHLYAYDDGVKPPLDGRWLQWRKVYSLCRALRYDVAFPFLLLPRRREHTIRSVIETVVMSDEYGALVGPVAYHDLFLKGRNEVFELADPVGMQAYRLTRQSFDMGVFTYNITMPGGGTEKIVTNHKCYSQSQSQCIYHHGGYCEIDDDGYPTSSSTICP